MKLAACVFAVLGLSTAPALAGGYDDVGDDGDGYGGYGATVVVTKRVIYAPPRPVYHVRRVIYAPAPSTTGTTEAMATGCTGHTGAAQAEATTGCAGHTGVAQAEATTECAGHTGAAQAEATTECAGVSLGD